MARRRFLIAYDIRDAQRLRQVCKITEKYGDRLQYSVFVCDLNPMEHLHAKADMERTMLMTEDSVVIIDVGEFHRSLQRTGHDGRVSPKQQPVETQACQAQRCQWKGAGRSG